MLREISESLSFGIIEPLFGNCNSIVSQAPHHCVVQGKRDLLNHASALITDQHFLVKIAKSIVWNAAFFVLF